MAPMLPDWMIEQIERERREREERQRPRLEINAPPSIPSEKLPEEKEKRGVVTIQIWGD